MKRYLICLLVLFSLSLRPNVARAGAFGDAAISVGLGTLAGGLLGASTLPFYPIPKEHTENIFYGAALGAVIGVVVASYAGFPSDDEIEGLTEEEETASTRKLPQPMAKLQPEKSPALLNRSTASVIGMPIAKADFTVVRW